MYKSLRNLSIFGLVAVMALTLGILQPGQAAAADGMGYFWQGSNSSTVWDRTPSNRFIDDTNRFGDDMALNNVFGGNRDADERAYNPTPYTYGLHGNYGYYQGGA